MYKRQIIGKDASELIHAAQEDDVDWLRAETREAKGAALAKALDDTFTSTICGATELTDEVKAELKHILYRECARVWRAKFDLGSPAHLPPMEIKLIDGATPKGVRRPYRWTRDQHGFLRSHLNRLVNTGIILPIETEWVCPIVLPAKKDGTWRLCVDPSP